MIYCGAEHREFARTLVQQLELPELIGQLVQVNADGGLLPESLRESIRAGKVGSAR